jgi:hypothetical protein
MSDTERDYQVGPGKPPLHTRFKKGQSGDPRGRHAKNLPELLVAALNQPVAVTENGRRRRVCQHRAGRAARRRRSCRGRIAVSARRIARSTSPTESCSRQGFGPVPELDG